MLTPISTTTASSAENLTPFCGHKRKMFKFKMSQTSTVSVKNALPPKTSVKVKSFTQVNSFWLCSLLIFSVLRATYSQGKFLIKIF